MNLHKLLCERAEAGKPLRVGLIGAGKFGTMFLAQALRTPGLHLLGVADLAPARARENLARVGWPAERIAAASLGEAVDRGTTWVGDDAQALIAHPALDVVIDATGHPPAGIAHALAAIANGKHIVMVNVEADVLAGPLLAQKARAAGVVYSLAYGDQPALIAEQVDWARACGFDVVAAGKGTKYLPAYHQSTPETVWGHYGLTAEQARLGGMNAQMFNSFLDGTKSAIEMAAVANATGLTPAPDGLAFPPCGVDDLPRVLRPASDGGQLHHKGQVEVVSSLERDGRPVFRDLRWGVYVVFEAPSDYVRRCFARVRPRHRSDRPLRRALQALSPDRARARHLRRQRRPARRADRRAHRLPRRRRRHRQARPRRRRDARRRGRLHGLGQAHAGRRQPAPGRPADRPRAPREAAQSRSRRDDRALGRRRHRRERARRCACAARWRRTFGGKPATAQRPAAE